MTAHTNQPRSSTATTTAKTATFSSLLQRKCACGSPTSSLTSACPECVRKKPVQTKLRIGASNDPLELEADRIADQILAAPASSTPRGLLPRIQRATDQASAEVDTAPASVDSVIASPGKSLDLALQKNMSQRFGHDFSRVRIHSGAAAEQSTRDVNAIAYTVGHNIVFGANQYAPNTARGMRLLAHELTHVVQQNGYRQTLMRACDCPAIGARQADPTVPLEAGVASAFPGLVAGDWCVLQSPTPTFNCYAWSVGDTTQWIDSQVDSRYGDNDGNLSFADFDEFYRQTQNLYPQTAPDSSTFVALFAKGGVPQHAALVAGSQSCGSIPFTSKLGRGPLIAHDLYQLEGSTYGTVARYYG